MRFMESWLGERAGLGHRAKHMKSCGWVQKIQIVAIVSVLLCPVAAAESVKNGQTTPAAKKEEGSKKAARPVNLPSAREILERYAKAIGGAEAFKGIKSQRAEGVVEMPGANIKGKLDTFAMRPNKLAIKMEMPGIGQFTTVYNGTNGWMDTAVTGPMLLPDKMLQQVSAQADFDYALHDLTNYTTAEVVGIEEFAGEECYQVKLVHKSGFESTEYFSKESGLLLGFTATQESPFGAVTGTTEVGDYKKFGEVTLPARTSQKVGGVETVMTITDMEFNNVDPEVFEPPAAVKTLLESKP